MPGSFRTTTVRSHSLRVLNSVLKKTKHRCEVTECQPFGLTRTCRAVYILQILHLVNDCQLFLPSLNIDGLLAITKVEDLKDVIEHCFPASASAPEEMFYVNSEAQTKTLRELSTKLSLITTIASKFALCLRRHDYLPSDGLVLKAFANLQLLLELTNTKCALAEQTLLKALDDYPETTEARLRMLMLQVRQGEDPFKDIPHITGANFRTLGVAQWVDDEVMNYFVSKWCQESSILGLSTFFACKHLFQDDSCLTAKSGTLTTEIERKALRWCAKTARNLGIGSWDSVFIPINENRMHWYSAYIDFRLKRIQIFDSLETTCVANRDKPLAFQKNMKLMLVLMWLAEVLGRLRGEPVFLKNDPDTEWICEPHSLVPFQPNTFDCGIHSLWHLQHLLRFRQIKQGPTAEPGLAFTDNMVGKRARLAGEMLGDCATLPRLNETMEFCCPVCGRSFTRAQDRNLHMDLKNDVPHRQYASLQARRISRRFNNTADAALVAATTSIYMSAPKDPQVTSIRHSERPTVMDDASMDVDMDVYAGSETDDTEGSICVETVETGDTEELQKDVHFADVLETAAEIMLDHADKFNFLPDSAELPEVSGDLQDEEDVVNTHIYRRMNRSLIEDQAQCRTYSWHPTAGKIYRHMSDVRTRWKALFSGSEVGSHEIYRPFASRLDWELAQWAVKEKITHSSFDRLLQIPEVKKNLGLNFTNTRSMLERVDQIPERCGSWYTKELAFKDRPDEKFVIRHRNPLEAIKALWGDPALSKHLVYKPTKLFRGEVQSEQERIFSEMWTGGFWNAAQSRIPEGGTIAPIILASDKTQLTQFSGNKSAYPVYLTIGNIPKALRRKPGARSCVLIAYLSIDKPLQQGLSKANIKLRNYELFHRSMAVVLEPLKAAGNPKGGGVEMVGGDGAVRKVYPLLATRKANELDLPAPGEPRTQIWTTATIQSARDNMRGRDRKIHALTMEEDVAGGNYEPFWVGFPLTDIHRCISPDILHQLYLGILKYLVSWIQQLMGEEELDKRIRALPISHGVRHFVKGISTLSQASGTEYKHIARILLACLVGKIDAKGITAARSLLHFIHLAQYPSHDQDTLGYMKDKLDKWHKNKSYFIEMGTREDFNIPKFHSLLHYVDSIRWLGTTDNCNTESFERLHIDFAKEGWRASNKRDHFPQMIQWLSRQEKVASFDFFQSWVDSESDKFESQGPDNPAASDNAGNLKGKRPGDLRSQDEPFTSQHVSTLTRAEASTSLHLAKSPQETAKKLTHIVASHAAPTFISELKLYLNSLLPVNQQKNKASVLQSNLPFTALDVWHQYKFAPAKLLEETEPETLKAVPITRKNPVPRFDTVIVLDSDEAESTAVEGCRAARLKVIFRLPSIVYRYGFPAPPPGNWPKEPLAYVTWYSRFKRAPDKATGMYRLEPALDSHRQPQGAIISLSDIRQGCMLVPARTQWEEQWTAQNVLDQCSSFFVNNLQRPYGMLPTLYSKPVRYSLEEPSRPLSTFDLFMLCLCLVPPPIKLLNEPYLPSLCVFPAPVAARDPAAIINSSGAFTKLTLNPLENGDKTAKSLNVSISMVSISLFRLFLLRFCLGLPIDHWNLNERRHPTLPSALLPSSVPTGISTIDDLPTEILLFIFSRLSFTRRLPPVPLNTVSKQWFATPPSGQHTVIFDVVHKSVSIRATKRPLG
ncbi:hypothetical protein D9757_012750 [Collybiopsis confluens]|uniref:Ubiquitin-like protease family profile domain-containing protein n=1 Tax=Collybiopsis confluens TaxID=2823264 RepID=A0A8H5GHC5_9AGAR|nr:hypothetical protein D9757_012750 [Collybiopsis confluens]